MTTESSVAKQNAALVEIATASASLGNALADVSKFGGKIGVITTRLEKLADIERRAKQSVEAEEAKLSESERALNVDTESIDGRRVAMYSLGAHVKKSAEREITEAAVELEARKPVVAALKLRVAELVARLKAGLAEQAKEVSKLTLERKELLEEKTAADSREREARSRLTASVAALELENRAVVERTLKRYPSDPSTTVHDYVCCACKGSMSPKLVVDFLNGPHIVRCSECSRFVVAVSGKGVTAPVAEE